MSQNGSSQREEESGDLGEAEEPAGLWELGGSVMCCIPSEIQDMLAVPEKKPQLFSVKKLKIEVDLPLAIFKEARNFFR